MADLSTAQGRITTSRRPTTNRDGILPERRMTSLPDVEVAASMRNAVRGDPQGESLRRALGMLPQAVKPAVDALATQQKQERSAQGALDAASGKEMDPARAGNKAYSSAFYSIKAERDFNAFAARVQNEAEDAINAGGDPDEVQAMVLGKFQEFISETTAGIPDAEVRLQQAQRLSSFGSKSQQDILAGIKARTDTEAREALQGNVQARLTTGQPLDFEGLYRQALPVSASPAEAKKTILDATIAFAVNPDDPHPEVLDELLNAKKADGKTPSLSAVERQFVMNAKAQAENASEARDRKVKEAYEDEASLQWFTAANEGVDVSDKIEADIKAGKVDVNVGLGWLGAMRNLRNQTLDGEANEDFILDLQKRMVQPGAEPRSFRGEVAKAYKEGRFGTGRAADKAYIQIMGGISADIESEQKAAQARAAAGGGGSTFGIKAPVPQREAYSFVASSLDPGKDGSVAQQRAYVNIVTAYRQRIVKGDDPWVAAQETLTYAKTFGLGPGASSGGYGVKGAAQGDGKVIKLD